ncbi:MAG: protein-glutamate O-methyltransferase CheR [Nitrospirota bacterium]
MLNIPLQDSTFKQLRDFIYETSGIFIPDIKKYFLENRLIKRLQEKNINSFEDYLYLLKYSANGDELAKLFDAVTTNETFFFREQQQLDVFFNFIIPEVTKTRGTDNLKIWSAACSTGEEPYTIVMMHKERMSTVRMDVFASDISAGVLKSAVNAVYSSYSVRNVPEPFLKKYFRVNGHAYELEHSIKNSVKFMNINLVDEKKMRFMRDVDVIFCRNVLIYFDDRAKQKVVSFLYGSLKTRGFLFIGTSESLHNITRAFRPVIFNRVVVYQKV